MHFAGIGWSEWGYRVTGLDRTGARSLCAEFGADRTGVADLVAMLLGSADRAGGVACFVDSSNGLLADILVEAGLPVYRLDPPLLGGPPPVDPWTLASMGREAIGGLHPLDRAVGILRGRVEEFDAVIGAWAGVERERAGAGRFPPAGDGTAGGVALTFDDGPCPPYSAQVLDVLRDFGVPATFFCVGLMARAYPEIVARARAEGSSVGNHTWSHPFLPDLDDAGLQHQVRATDAALAGAGSRLFRPPYGACTPDAWRVLDELGEVLVGWDVEASDWRRPGTAAIVEAVLRGAGEGSIVLLHDGGGDRSQTVAALPSIIEGLLGRGHRLVTVGSLLNDNGRRVRSASAE